MTYTKSQRQVIEYSKQVNNLEKYERRFIRKAMIHKSLHPKQKKLELSNELLGLLHKINKCRKQLKMVSITNIDKFLPNKPPPKNVILALKDESTPQHLYKRLLHPPHNRNINDNLWLYEKNILREYIKSGRYVS